VAECRSVEPQSIVRPGPRFVGYLVAIAGAAWGPWESDVESGLLKSQKPAKRG
jgi:hypothetical protein